jgi:flavin reductase (DIM6/NTAB) family NADH-FMN oxidoreductase RutF
MMASSDDDIVISTSQQELSSVEEVEWVRLSDGKQLSRLLYPNPVCFLCTWCRHDQVATLHDITQNTSSDLFHNVMVSTWLTATNNSGRFMYSLNRRRHTASILQKQPEFTLSVPVQGMEDLVRNVGSVSGRDGSKFPTDHSSSNVNVNVEQDAKPMSKRQKKKLPAFVHGIAGLESVPFGNCIQSTHHPSFAIAGTISHLRCEVYTMLEDQIDNEHFLVLAEVKEAFVHPSYWNAHKNVFRPTPSVPPYLTFFGSKMFGVVHALPELPDETDNDIII